MSIAFGKHLCELRKSRTKYRQADMAEMLNISRSAYTYYENGKSEPSLRNLRIICKIIMVDFNTLFDYEE